MNLKDYEEKYFSTYQDFAEMVRFILEKALLAAKDLQRPQSIQCRAKGIDSLRDRLAEEGKLDTQTLECDRRDLAGARLIFYTNNDVDNFIASSLMYDNFFVEEDSTRIHHRTPENEGTQYRAIHYTVRLSEARIGLPEYKRFAGLRCEIQIQTILNHAWSETSHDILYKNRPSSGYGAKAMKDIERRFKRIMHDHLMPAGHEIQKAQKAYETLRLGQGLFDSGIVNSLDNAQNNNDRHDILSELSDYVLPHYDDLPTAYKGLQDPLLRAVKAARSTEPVPIETTYGTMEGYKPDAIAKLVVEIIDDLSYVDVVGTLQLLIDIYRDEPNDAIRQQIVDTVKNLSEYNIDAYNKVGPMLQMALVDHLARMSAADVESVRPIALTVWAEAVKSGISILKRRADSLELREGAVPVSGWLKEVRDKAISALFGAYDRSLTDEQKRAILSALHGATTTPSKAGYANELLTITLKDAKRIVDFVTERARTESYELQQYLERSFLAHYFRAQDLADDPRDRFGCQAEAASLVAAILKLRDTINEDNRFVRFKVIVESISVYPGHWKEKEFDYQKANEYRRGETDRYIDEINEENENDWFDLIERCAETDSNGSPTFPALGNFISKLAERKPKEADRLLAKASDNLLTFLAEFLNGLALSNRPDIYERTFESELESARNLPGVAKHLRRSENNIPDFAARLLKRAVDQVDAKAVNECLLFGLEHYGTKKILDSDAFLRDALSFLNDHRDCRWVGQSGSLRNAGRSYKESTKERAAQLLQNLGYVHRVNYDAERVLARLAERQPEAVWDYFGARLAREAADGNDEEGFKAVPYEFCCLAEELSKDPQLAICKGLLWFTENRQLFRYGGARLLGIVFRNCPPNFADALLKLVKAGGETEADFALEILQDCCAETSIHGALKEIVSRFPDYRNNVFSVLANPGETSGIWDFVKAWRTRKESLKEWLADDRPPVKVFAERSMKELDSRIAAARSSAEEHKQMHKLSYDEDDDAGDE